jgi:hypothetical protein
MATMLKPTRTVAAVLCTVFALLLASGVGVAAAPSPSTQLVKATQLWTSTGITLRQGERVTIAATGQVHFGRPPIDAMSPAGVPWGSECTGVTQRQQRDLPWPAPGIACWSLIARVGESAPIAVGRSATITAPQAGVLELGVNDNYLPDNRGAWAATATVSPIASTESKSSSNNIAAILLIAAAVLALVILIVVLARRRSRRRPARAAPVRAAARSAVGPENDDVNIFEVEFVEGGLRVGYSYFPDGTVVRWLITRDGGAHEEGEFLAAGGTDAHYVVLAISDTTQSSRVAIRFDWSIGGVPFEYAITRNPTLRR